MDKVNPTQFFTYFSELIGKNVLGDHQHSVGVLCDIAMKINGEIYPRAMTLVVKKGLFKKRYASIPWEHIKDIGHIIKLNVLPDRITYRDSRPRFDFTLDIDILDQQIVDVHNKKAVRVNDIHLLRVDNQLYLAHVDVGLRGLVRRLGWTKFIDGVIRFFYPMASYLVREELISWKNARVLSLGQVKNLVKVDVARDKLAQMHPAELAEIMKDLDKVDRCSLFRSLDASLQRKAFADLTVTEQAQLIELLTDKEVVSLLENIPPDDAADVLLKLGRRKAGHLMSLIETKTSKKLSKLLNFSKDSAGGLMTTEFLALSQESLVKDALLKIKENPQIPNIYQIYLVDGEQHLLGMVPWRSLINVDVEKPLKDFCYPHKIFVRTTDKIKEVALLLEKYKFSAIAVVNETDVLQGVITIDDVMEELIAIAWKQYKENI